jgi:glycosyltransferase involved in cell wall biosynthesis
LLPTYYAEPFGCVVVEAMLSGTPVITTDWGAFPEINPHGVTGYRCRTFEQFQWAVEHIDGIEPATCRRWAIENFGMERVKHMYEEYFDMVSRLFLDKGFYSANPDRAGLGWLSRSYP